MAATRSGAGRSNRALVASSLGAVVIQRANVARKCPFNNKDRPTDSDSVKKERTSSKRGAPGRITFRPVRSWLVGAWWPATY